MDVPFKRLSGVAPGRYPPFRRRSDRARAALRGALPALPQWQAAQTVEALERNSGMPVIAYSHAAFFAAFKALAIRDPIRGHGRLLASLAEPAR